MLVAQDLKVEEREEVRDMADGEKDKDTKAATALERGDGSPPFAETDEADVGKFWSRAMSSWLNGWSMPEEFMRYGRPNRKAKTEPIKDKVG